MLKMEVYRINNESLTHLSQFISVKVKKKLRKSQAHFQESILNIGWIVMLTQNDILLTKNRVQIECISVQHKRNANLRNTDPDS